MRPPPQGSWRGPCRSTSLSSARRGPRNITSPPTGSGGGRTPEHRAGRAFLREGRGPRRSGAPPARRRRQRSGSGRCSTAARLGVGASSSREPPDAANAAANAWRKALPKGPYGINVARTGRHAVCYGAGGRVEVLDLHRNVRTAEIRCGEVCRAATFLHDETMVAVAQRKYVYVYDQDGAEVHRMAKHLEPEHLSYLPFHFLLASAGHAGWLKYNDVSTGQFVAEHNTRAGAPRSLAQNPQTAVLCMGHGNGVCSLWSPAQSKPLARLLCHRGAVLIRCPSVRTPSPRRRLGRVGASLRRHRGAASAASGPL